MLIFIYGISVCLVLVVVFSIISSIRGGFGQELRGPVIETMDQDQGIWIATKQFKLKLLEVKKYIGFKYPVYEEMAPIVIQAVREAKNLPGTNRVVDYLYIQGDKFIKVFWRSGHWINSPE